MKLVLDPIWSWPLVAIVIGGLLAMVLVTYPPRIRHLPPFYRRLLLGLRLLAAVMLALAMLRHLAGTLRAATGRIFDLSTLGAHNRIHAELLRLAKPGPEEQNTAVIRPIPVHGDIASRVSTTRETVARALGELGRRGLVRREGDTLIVQDLRAFIGMVKDFKG